jgi:homoserine acetyltransferase
MVHVDRKAILAHGVSLALRWSSASSGQPLDAARYFIVIPDNLGHGKSSKPSDGLRARFPRYWLSRHD